MTPSRYWVAYGVAVAAIAACLLLLNTLEQPGWWLLWAAMLLAVAAGAAALTVLHHKRQPFDAAIAALRSMLAPLALAAGGSLFVHEFLGGHYAWGGAVATIVGVAAVLYAQTVTGEVAQPGSSALRLVSTMGMYLAAFLIFTALQSFAIPAPWSVLLLGALAGLLASEIFDDRGTPVWRQALYGLLVTLVLGELGWTASFLPWGKVLTGLMMLLAFYLLSGLIHHHLQDRLTKWVTIEFAGVTVIALLLVYRFHGMGG